jgi:hypothetical protein
MANISAPAGFIPCDHLGTAYAPTLRKVVFAASDGTAAYKGSLVKFTGAMDTDGVTPVVTLASPSDTKIAGAIVSVAYGVDTGFTTYYRLASTRTYAYIPTDPQQLYQVQENSVGGGGTGGNIDQATKVGDNCNFTAESGDTTYGTSTMQLDSATAANTAALPIRLWSVANRIDNDPTSTNRVWIVKINQNAYDNTTGAN